MSEADDEQSTTPLERILRPLVEHPALRPLLIVVVLILGTFVAGGVMLALRNRNLFAMLGIAALVLLAGLGVLWWISRRERQDPP